MERGITPPDLPLDKGREKITPPTRQRDNSPRPVRGITPPDPLLNKRGESGIAGIPAIQTKHPCKGVMALGATLRECEDELRSTLEDWILVGLKLGHRLPVIGGIDLNREPVRAPVDAV